METIENLVKTTLGEIEKVLTTRTVVGDPITVEGRTLIPVVSVGFVFSRPAWRLFGTMATSKRAAADIDKFLSGG